MQDLIITGLQLNLYWENRDANLQHIEDLVKNTPSSDVIVLPEMFSTGFSMRAADLSEPHPGPTLGWMTRLARTKQAAVCGSIMVQDQELFYNRYYWVNPDGSFQTYDKRHLFSLAGEDRIFNKGDKQLLIHYKGWRIRPVICYDLRFPVWCANADPPYDVLLVVANWPDRRISHWDSLLPARAIENQAFVVAVNRVGTDGNAMEHSGHSAFYSPDGSLMQQHLNEESAFQMVLEYRHITAFRTYLSALADSDKFTLES